MKKYKILLFLLLLVGSQFYAQRTVTVVGDKLKIKNLVQNNDATRVVVQDSISKEFFFISKDSVGTGGGGGNNINFQEILSFATASAMPVTGEVAKLYYTIDNGYYYKWDDPVYNQIVLNADWNATSGVSFILNKPTIPAAQVKSDWNATSGVSEILNKPTIPSIAGLAPITYVDSQDALKQNIFTAGSNVIINNTNPLVPVISAKNNSKTYYINASTGNNATGLYEDESKPFLSIDYVNANYTIKNGDTFYLQGTGLTYPINAQLKAVPQYIKADPNSTNILDFSNNSNTSVMENGTGNNLVTIEMLNGKINNNRNGGTGVVFTAQTGAGTKINFNVNEIYWNTSTYMALTSGDSSMSDIKAKIISSRGYLSQYVSNDITINTYNCLANGASLCLFGKNIKIRTIQGSGSYTFGNGYDTYTVGNISTTGINYLHSGGNHNIIFNNSVITGGGFGFSPTSNGGGTVIISGNIVSASRLFRNAATNPISTKFINFSANLGVETLNYNNNALTFENCNIKSINSPLTIANFPTAYGDALGCNITIKNSTFQVVNSVPLVTGTTTGTNVINLQNLNTNATVITDNPATVTVNYIGRLSIQDGVNPKDAVNKSQLDAAIISGGGGTIDETNLVHKTGDETIDGTKTFSQTIITSNGIAVPGGAGSNSIVWSTDGTAFELNTKLDAVNYVAPKTGQIIVTSGTSFTTPATITTNTLFEIELVGGGGAGGAVVTTNSSGTGGGGGGYGYKRCTGLSPSTTYPCTIGVGGQTTAANGTNTSLTLLGTTYFATGGLGGVNSVSADGGLGGFGSSTDLNMTGEAGEDSTSTASGAVLSSAGGNSPKGWGTGGKGVRSGQPGKNGVGYGGGGSAGKQNSIGGQGSNGIIFAKWYNQ